MPAAMDDPPTSPNDKNPMGEVLGGVVLDVGDADEHRHARGPRRGPADDRADGGAHHVARLGDGTALLSEKASALR